MMTSTAAVPYGAPSPFAAGLHHLPFAPPAATPPAPAPAVSTRELEINNARNKATLTRKATHEHILAETGTTVMIRGRYKPPGDTSTDERPLHLLLQARSVDALDQAEAALRELMGPMPADGADGAAADGGAREPAAAALSGPLVELVEVDVDAVFQGHVRGKVLGPRGTYIRHIETEAGVRVQLVGGHFPSQPGMVSEKLFIEITAATDAQLKLARGLAESLVRSVKQRLAQGTGVPPLQQQSSGASGGSAGQSGCASALPLAGLPQPPPPPPGCATGPPSSAFAPPASYGASSGHGDGPPRAAHAPQPPPLPPAPHFAPPQPQLYAPPYEQPPAHHYPPQPPPHPQQGFAPQVYAQAQYAQPQYAQPQHTHPQYAPQGYAPQQYAPQQYAPQPYAQPYAQQYDYTQQQQQQQQTYYAPAQPPQ
jgi:hypothetical protein